MATTITANGINFPDGSAGSPSIGGSDTNTGLFTGSDIVGFATGGNERLKIDASGNINIANDSGKLQLGASNDLQIFHDGSGSFISDTGTGSLAISGSVVNINNSDNSEFQIKAVENAQVELYHNGSKKFETYTYGVNISGTAKIESGGNFHAHDNVKFIAGTGEDLQIYHNGSTSIIDSTTCNLDIQSSNTINIKAADESSVIAHANGAVELYHDNVKTFQTDGNGIMVLGPEGGTANVYIYADEGDDNADKFQLTVNNGGPFHIQNRKSGGVETNLKCYGDGAVELYYDNSKKLETTSGGVDISGATDGVLNINTTDSRGSFIRFKENGTSKCFVGCAEGLGAGDQDDLGLRTTDNIIFMIGSSQEFKISGTNGRLERTFGGGAGSGSDLDGMWFNNDQYPTGTFIRFWQTSGTYGANQVGSISHSASNTSYNTSSDYRLKENATTISDGITRLKTLKPYRFNFISDPSNTVDGFFAHEAAIAVPEAITGTKDEIDSDNNPIYQGIDQSKIVPLLVAALQEAVGRIEALEGA